jgi:hypothetical protein
LLAHRYTGLSYHQKKLLRCKVSPRDMALGAYLRDHVHYKAHRTTKWPPIEVDRTIQFGDGTRASTYVLANPLLMNDSARDVGLTAAFVNVANSGLFLRAAATRREFIYWLPGLNAGVPLVPKADPVHETTFQVCVAALR